MIDSAIKCIPITTTDSIGDLNLNNNNIDDNNTNDNDNNNDNSYNNSNTNEFIIYPDGVFEQLI